MRLFQGTQFEEGFTLLELIVAVAIVGILASIAIPGFQKYELNAQEAEAKITVANLYTAEQSFFLISGSYTVCLAGIGGLPDQQSAMRYYAAGFPWTPTPPAGCGPKGNGSCAATDWDQTSGAATVPCSLYTDVSHTDSMVLPVLNSASPVMTNSGAVSQGLNNYSDRVSQTQFRVAALNYFAQKGTIFSSSKPFVCLNPNTDCWAADIWQIDQNKVIIHY